MMQNQTATSPAAAVDQAALDQAFAALKTFDWGGERKSLSPIEDALTATRGDAAARKDLESRLAAALGSALSQAGKDFVCRALTMIGTGVATPALAALLVDANLSHMARYALERIPAAEAAAALRAALPKLGGKLKIGVIGSLGVRRDDASVPTLTQLIGDADLAVAAAAASALGDIGSAAAAEALCAAIASAPASVKPRVADAALAAAERLSTQGNAAAALKVCKLLAAGDYPKNIRMAATRGALRGAGSKQ